MNYYSLEKKFSVGLCLNEPIEELQNFFEKNQRWLNSVYFSLPLGNRFFSRDSLANEYKHNESKLFGVLDFLSSLGIRREMAINTWNLTSEEIHQAIHYCNDNNFSPEEIVCLRDYANAFRTAFPNSEIKYSVNNPEANGKYITKEFNTLIAGKGLLRDMSARHHFFKQGYGVTLLLNNGCISICNTPCETIHCHHLYDDMINKHGLDYIFALCSFFPSELQALLECDTYASRYKFKISNRPIGLPYTQKVLDSYLKLEDDYDAMRKDYREMALFCTVHPLAIRLKYVNLKNVADYKKKLMAKLNK